MSGGRKRPRRIRGVNQCVFCGGRFTSLQELSDHLLARHSGERTPTWWLRSISKVNRFRVRLVEVESE